MTAHPGLTGSPVGPRGFNARVAQSARVYDYWLGGKDNFQADRVAGEQTIAAYPAICSSARSNREFLTRAVSYLAGVRRIRQFLDIGAGLPAAPNTHEVAQSIEPASRVVYVDNDPMVLSHARALLASGPQGEIAHVEADLRDTGTILTQAAGILDLTQPAAILLLAVLDHIPDLDDARRAVARLLAAVLPGSFLVISHAASDIDADETGEMISRLNEHLAGASLVGRPRDAIAGFFDGLELVGPGVVKVTQWYLGTELTARARTFLWGGMARKPGSSGRD